MPADLICPLISPACPLACLLTIDFFDLFVDLRIDPHNVSSDLRVYLPAGLLADRFTDLFDPLVGLSPYLFVALLVSLFGLSADMSAGLSIDH